MIKESTEMECEIPELNHHRYKPVGHCIYCGDTEDLRDEHIVPYGLGGNLILPKSSCGMCADITSKFERSVQRGSFWPARIFRDIQSRRKHRKAPEKYPLIVERNGKEETIQISLEEYPILLPFPIFAVPAYLNPEGYEKGIILEGMASVSFGPRPEHVLTKFGADRLSVQPKGDKPVDFARMIAKIAFSMAVAAGALEQLEESNSPVLSAILGKTDDIGRWVGTITEPTTQHEKHLHRVLIHRDEQKNLLVGGVHIFSDSQTPHYGVIIGKLKK